MAYIYLKDFEDAEAVRQHLISAYDMAGDLMLDFDKRGRLLGIEVRFASKALPSEFLDEAERVPDARKANLS